MTKAAATAAASSSGKASAEAAAAAKVNIIRLYLQSLGAKHVFINRDQI